MSSPERIAIVGAGISGLTCAWYLQKELPNATIDLFESSDSVGGVIKTVVDSPYLVELGADNVATFIPEVGNFIRDLGIEEEFIRPNGENRFAQVVRQGKLVPIPNGFSLMQPTQLRDLLLSPILSVSGKVRVLTEYFIRAKPTDEDESVEAFAVRRLGRECFDRLVEPIIGGIFTARAETLSMKATMRQFRTMEREHGGLIRGALAKRRSQTELDASARNATGARYDQFLGPKQGMGWWMETIHRQLRCQTHFNSSVQGIESTSTQRWKLRGENLGDATEYDSVCLAMPAWRSAEILQSTAPSVAHYLERIPYASSAIAILGVPKNEIKPSSLCFGVVIPKTESRDCLAISLTSEKYPNRCPKDTVLVRVFMGGMIRPELLDYSDEKLLHIAKQEVRSLLGVESLPRWQKLVRYDQAMPQYLIGHCEKVEAIERELEKHPGLFLTGNAFDGVGIPQCIRHAKRTAEKVARGADDSALLSRG